MGRTFAMWLVLCLTLGSCSSASRDVRGRDHNTVLPAFRMAIDLRDPEASDPNRPIAEVEFDISGAEGDMHNAGIVTGEYRLVEGGVNMRLGRQFRDKIRLAGILGVGLNRIDLIDRTALPVVDDSVTELGFRLGGELRLRFAEFLWGHTRVVTFVRPFDMASTQSEIGFLLGRPNEVGLLIGYRDWHFQDESSDLQGVDEVDLRADGLFLAMELHF
jgi:hypothetical protein